MAKSDRPDFDGFSFSTSGGAETSSGTPASAEAAFSGDNPASLHGMEDIRIGEDGKASDMNDRTVMSADGCNPVNQDTELAHAHNTAEPDGAGILPGTMPGSMSGTFPTPIPPAYFPGSGSYPGGGGFPWL